MKDTILVISLVLAVGLAAVVVRLYQADDKARKNLDEERYSRMVAEETLQKNDAKLSFFQQKLKDDQDKMSQITDILTQEKDVNSNLKKQYDDLMQAKTDLEAKLETVLHERSEAVAALQAQAKTQGSAAPAVAPAPPAVPAATAGK